VKDFPHLNPNSTLKKREASGDRRRNLQKPGGNVDKAQVAGGEKLRKLTPSRQRKTKRKTEKQWGRKVNQQLRQEGGEHEREGLAQNNRRSGRPKKAEKKRLIVGKNSQGNSSNNRGQHKKLRTRRVGHEQKGETNWAK